MQRYITRGVNIEIGLGLQILIWELAETVPCEKDYLQVFTLEPGIIKGRAVQIIHQSQEIPPFERTYSFFCENTISEKLFLINDGDGDHGDGFLTLMLASEY